MDDLLKLVLIPRLSEAGLPIKGLIVEKVIHGLFTQSPALLRSTTVLRVVRSVALVHAVSYLYQPPASNIGLSKCDSFSRLLCCTSS